MNENPLARLWAQSGPMFSIKFSRPALDWVQFSRSLARSRACFAMVGRGEGECAASSPILYSVASERASEEANERAMASVR